jgi:4-hydroxy-3-methylbut-2-enyl diphosphate reductase IspH
VERATELRAEWFRGARTVGLTAGTSTLRETVATVRARLEEIAAELAAAAR